MFYLNFGDVKLIGASPEILVRLTDGKIELRPTMTVSFTYDHRVMDGAPIAKFYTKITELADNPEYLLA